MTNMGLLFVGLDNPQSSDPRYALYPRPANCAGHRLLKMIQLADSEFTERAYINIPKTNLFPVGMCPRAFKHGSLHAAGGLLKLQLSGRGVYVVLFGADVRDAVLGSDVKESVFVEDEESYYAWLPHPSGRNRAYNGVAKQRKVGKFLRELVREKMGV